MTGKLRPACLPGPGAVETCSFDGKLKPEALSLGRLHLQGERKGSPIIPGIKVMFPLLLH